MVSAIIVAGGSGQRMGSSLKKQYLGVDGVPILTRTLQVFERCDAISGIFLAVPETDFDYCRKTVLGNFSFKKEISLVPGGKERQASVYNGLVAAGKKLAPEGLVVIHDGVRPFVDVSAIRQCIRGAEEKGACIIALPAFDTIKRVDGSGLIQGTIDREEIWLAQTPQAFSYSLIRDAHERALAEGFLGTDDASLVEHCGKRVSVIEGSRTNIKITTKEDLLLARAFIAGGIAESFRSGGPDERGVPMGRSPRFPKKP